jgi:2-polyprenyl-6-hydroxyphenyl methylase/3-demethylubiquinone-9 3-methyltransferase
MNPYLEEITSGKRFEFGKNWQSFVHTAVNEQRITRAVDSLRRLLKIKDLQGKTFLDIGCGSGLFPWQPVCWVQNRLWLLTTTQTR